MVLSFIISGIVHQPDGTPVSLARVYFVTSPVQLPDIAAFTDADGRFRLSVPATGTYSVASSRDGYVSGQATVSVTGQDETLVEIVLDRSK